MKNCFETVENTTDSKLLEAEKCYFYRVKTKKLNQYEKNHFYCNHVFTDHIV